MDCFAGECWLDWWANSATNLAGIAVSAVIASTSDGWDAHAYLVNPDDRKTFAFLYGLDPLFMLRFQDGSTIPVTATLTDDRLTLTEQAESL
ncbi:hypothetical protein Athai_32450 [Actinocatenispora thailandica]|uniref:Uncharacterized protein n=1 Tax=Actinocatenispora thailandica TaxID=227318 RepID=A0A7R7DQ75_9ACTN|nr:hypothetical protein [Actinocatenispora thailandica]BCJ35742.1 hypothetical protein Athai_32450 [Actinocatenispora thailandica]